MSILPTYTGFIERPDDALILISACRQGAVPRIQRKLHDTEKLQIVKSGSIFIWVEQESNLHRWTDGRSWSASRGTHGGFLLYREMLRRGGGRSRTAGAVEMRRSPTYESPQYSKFRAHVRSLAGSLLNRGEFDELVRRGQSGAVKSQDKFKRGGLFKKTFSLDMPNEKWHLVAYYSLEDALMGCLPTPRRSPSFGGVSIGSLPEEIQRAYFSRPDSSSPPCSPASDGIQIFYDTGMPEGGGNFGATEVPDFRTAPVYRDPGWDQNYYEPPFCINSATTELCHALDPTGFHFGNVCFVGDCA